MANELERALEPSEIGTITATGWVPPTNMTHEGWQQIGAFLQGFKDVLPWLLGDWLNEGETRYGETYSQAIKYTDRNLEQLKQYKWVAGSIERARRRQGLTFTHHRYVAHLKPAEQDKWLDRAEQEGLTSGELWDLLKPAGRGNSNLARTATPEEAVAWLSKHFTPEWRLELATLLLD